MKSRIWEMKGVKYAKTLAQRNFSYARCPEKCFTEIYTDLYGYAGNQLETYVTEFCNESENLSSRNS